MVRSAVSADMPFHFISIFHYKCKLSERYGNIYSVYLGSFPVVVLNGLQAIKEGLVAHSGEFSDRPTGFLINELTEGKGKHTINWKT